MTCARAASILNGLMDLEFSERSVDVDFSWRGARRVARRRVN